MFRNKQTIRWTNVFASYFRFLIINDKFENHFSQNSNFAKFFIGTNSFFFN